MEQQSVASASVASGGTTISSSGGLAGRYAAALYAYAEDQHALDAVVSEMDALGRLIEQSADFRRLIESPLIDIAQARKAALAVLAAEGFGKPVQDFVGVIANNRRLAALPQIVHAFAALVAEKRGVITAHVASAHPLSDVQRQQLRARLIEAGTATSISRSEWTRACSAASSCGSALAFTIPASNLACSDCSSP